MIRKFNLIVRTLIVIACLLITSIFTGCQSRQSPDVPAKPSISSPVPSPEVEGEIIVFASSATAEYPDALHFDIDIESLADIARVELEYRIMKISTVDYVSAIMADFEPAKKVKTCIDLEMVKIGGLPPGADIEYVWIIEDEEGRHLETEVATVRFDDSRYSWKNVSQGTVELYWYEGDADFAEELMNAAIEALDMLAEDTGTELLRPVKIYIYKSSQDLKGAMIYPQEWTGGVAYSEFGITAIGIAPNNVDWGKRVIAHELAHLLVYQITYNPYGRMPVWVDEGLATYAEGNLTSHMQTVLDDAIRTDDLVSVHSLCSSFPAGGKVELYYAESYSLVKFLIDTYGQEKMLELLRAFKQGDQYNDALIKVYGFDLNSLENAWRTSLGL